MVLPGHLAGGYLAARAVLALAPASLTGALTHGQIVALLVIGTLAGEGPDIDLFWYSFKHRILKSAANDDHREYATHAPVVWLALSLLIVLAGALAGSAFVELIGWAALAGSWSHLIFDSIEHGVMWLWPFSARRFALRDISRREAADEALLRGAPGSLERYWSFIARVYPYRATFYIEIAATIAALALFIHSL